MVIRQSFLNQRLSKEKAKKGRVCRFCPRTWEAGDLIYIMRDPIKDNFELLCLPCGDDIVQGQKEHNNPTTTVEYEVEDDDNLLSNDESTAGEGHTPAPKTDLKKDSLVDLIEDLYTRIVELRRLVNND